MVGTKKSLGQHWLKNRAILNDIADLSLLGVEGSAYDSSDGNLICVEIGPGLGFLTSSLLKRFDKVIAVEYDDRLAENLPKSFPGKNLEVVNMDFLKYDLSNLPQPYAVVGNIPYYITSPIIQKLLETSNKPERIVLLIQKEVAERIAAKKGDHTVLSLFVQNNAGVTLGPVVGRELFTPAPKVDSQVIILDPLAHPQINPATFTLIKRGFSAPRKKLIKNLGQVSKEELLSIFDKIGISKDARPADLELGDWEKLAESLK